MNLPFPKTRDVDYIEFQRELLRINHGILRNQISKDNAQIAYEKLLKDYKGKLFEEDLFYFDNLEDLTRELEVNVIDRQSIAECVEHEGRHARAAIKLGYNVSYSFVRSYSRIGEKLLIRIFPRIGVSHEGGLNYKNLFAIINAVDNPSPLDIEAVADIPIN